MLRARLATFLAGCLSIAIFLACLSLGLGLVGSSTNTPTTIAQFLPQSAYAATSSLSRQIPLTARLIDPTSRLPVANGTYSVRFAIYSADRTTSDAYPSDTDSGLRLWTETKDITIKNGIISTLLGSVTALPTTIDFSSNSLYLAVRVNTDPELVPRRKLGTVPSAISSDNLQGKVPGFDADQLPYTNSTGILALTNGMTVSSTPTASSTTALIRLGSALSGASSSGTYFGANAALGFAGNLVDLQVNGTSKFTVNSAGQITAGSISSGVIGNSAVTSISKTGGTARNGAITLTEGSNISITDNGDNSFTLGSSASVTLQGAYGNTSGNTITTTDARDIAITLADTTTDANLTVNIASGSTSKFKVQGAGTDKFTVDSAGSVTATNLVLSGGTIASSGSNISVSATVIPTGAGINVGSAANRYATGYFDNLNVNTIDTSGTSATSFSINTNQLTNNTDSASVQFYLGPTLGTYSALQWIGASNRFGLFSRLSTSTYADIYLGSVTSNATVSAGTLTATGTVSGATVNGTTVIQLNGTSINTGGTLTNVAYLDQANTFSVNGAASTPAQTLSGTWFSGGSATTTKPQLLVQPTGTASTAWSTSGTGIGANAASGFAGNLIDLQVAASSKFSVSGAGVVSSAGTINGATISGGTLSGGSLSATAVNGLSVASGDITVGTWSATAIGASKGGTAIDSSASTGVATVSAGTWSISSSIGATQGGTGQTSVTTGDLLYGSGTNTWSKLADVATGSVLISGGIGVAPAWSATPTLTTSLTVPTILTSSSDLALQASTGIVNINKASVQNKLRVFESAVTPTKYTEITHDGTNGKVSSSSGELQLSGTGTNQLVVGAVGTAVDLVFEENSSILGQGTNTITLGQSGDTFNLNTSGVTYNVGTLSAGAAILNTTTTGSTALKVNAATGQSGLLLDLQVNSVSKASIDANGLITSVGFTSSGTNTISTSAANALALTGTPATSATSSLLQLGSAIAGGSSNGTYVGINSAAGYTGNFLDYQVNGTSRFYISNTGAVSITETTSTGTGTSITANSLTTGDGLLIQSSSLTTGNLVSLTQTGTAAGSNTQTILKVSTSGVNATSTQTTYGVYATNTHGGTASTNVAGYFAASGGTVNIAAQFDGHVKSTQTTAPTIGTPINCGTTPTAAVTASSTDSAGSFTITAGTGSPTTCDTIFTFNNTFGAAPKSIILTPSTATGGAKDIYVSASSATTFTVKLNTSPAASEANTYYYQVIE